MKEVLLNSSELSDSKEVYDSKPNPVCSLLIYWILLLIVVAGVWAYFGKIDIVVKSEAVIRSNEQVSTVINCYEGRVLEIKVKDGQKVKKGDILYRLDCNIIKTEKEYNEKKLNKVETEIRLLNKLKRSILKHKNYFNSESKKEELYYIQYETYYLEYQILKYDTDYTSKECCYIDENGKQCSAACKQYELNTLSDILKDIEEKKNVKKELELTIETLEASVDNTIVKAQIDGIINMNMELVKGDVIATGSKILTIIPIGERLYKVCMNIKNQDISKLKKNMIVKCNVYALSNKEYGYITGKISNISESVKVNDINGTGYYFVEAMLDKSTLCDEKGEEEKIKNGMEGEVQIITERKRILTYLFEILNLQN